MLDMEDIVDTIYEASIVPPLWDTALEKLGGMVDSAGGGMIVRHPDGWGGGIAAGALAHPMTCFLQSPDVQARTRATAILVASNHPGFLAEEDLFAQDVRERDPLFAEILRPQGIGTSMATAIDLPTGELVLFLFARLHSQGNFQSGMKTRLDALRPHLARSSMISSRLRLQRLQAAAEALAILGLPAAILSRRGRVLAANNLLQKMDSHVVWLAQDHMALRDETANKLFSEAIGKMEHTGTAASLTFPCYGAQMDNPAVGHLIPTPGQARDIFDGSTVLFVLTPISVPRVPEHSLIQTLFDLTPTEARVARGLAEGASTSDIARRHGVSVETIRSQVKSILTKTGTNRQSELIMRLGAVSKLPMHPADETTSRIQVDRYGTPNNSDPRQ